MKQMDWNGHPPVNKYYKWQLHVFVDKRNICGWISNGESSIVRWWWVGSGTSPCFMNSQFLIFSDLFMEFISGWWYTYPSEKYERQWEGLSHILWKNKSHVPNHQPVDSWCTVARCSHAADSAALIAEYRRRGRFSGAFRPRRCQPRERRDARIILQFPSMDWFKGKFTGNHGFYH